VATYTHIVINITIIFTTTVHTLPSSNTLNEHQSFTTPTHLSMTVSTTTTTAAAVLTTNQHDHIIGHCRAQRQTLYSCSDVCTPLQSQPIQKPVATPQASEDDWTESQEELERWGMDTTEEIEPAPSEVTTPNDTHRGELKYEEVMRFWQ
jgi:hypothetical protein